MDPCGHPLHSTRLPTPRIQVKATLLSLQAKAWSPKLKGSCGLASIGSVLMLHSYVPELEEAPSDPARLWGSAFGANPSLLGGSPTDLMLSTTRAPSPYDTDDDRRLRQTMWDFTAQSDAQWPTPGGDEEPTFMVDAVDPTAVWNYDSKCRVFNTSLAQLPLDESDTTASEEPVLQVYRRHFEERRDNKRKEPFEDDNAVSRKSRRIVDSDSSGTLLPLLTYLLVTDAAIADEGAGAESMIPSTSGTGLG